MSNETSNSTDPEIHESSSFHKVWEFFASLRLAIVLMLILVGLSLVGAFVIQIPAQYAADPEHYVWWLENVAQTQTGAWYPLLRLLGFFNLFHSFWFIATGLLLIINIVVCSLNRWKQVRARLVFRKVVQVRTFFSESPESQVFHNIKSLEYLTAFLEKRRYKVVVSNQADEKYIMALKNRFSALGSYLVHVSLILFILGFVVGHYWGFQNDSLVITEGQTKAVEFNTGLRLKLEAFQDEYYPDGTPRDFTSHVVLFQDQKEVKIGQIQVNHPLKYQGVRFYQSNFGPAENIQIKRKGEIIYSGMVALESSMDNYPYIRPAGLLTLTEQNYSIYLVAPATNMPDPALQSGELGIEVYSGNSAAAEVATVITLNTPLVAGDLEILYNGSGHYSGFVVNSDPGIGFMWTAAVFLLIGLVVVFYFPRRQLQGALLRSSENELDLYLRWSNSAENSGDAQALADYLKKNPGSNSSGQT